jgi:Cu(I)/Ag(I) efflux system periplasmic protein CusF
MKHVLLAASLAIGSPVAAFATEAHHQSAQPGGQVADGEVRKVDRDANKLTIRHGPLPQLDMPTPMTMVYQVKDAALLDRVKPGDKVKFVAEKIGGAFTVISIDPVR